MLKVDNSNNNDRYELWNVSILGYENMNKPHRFDLATLQVDQDGPNIFYPDWSKVRTNLE